MTSNPIIPGCETYEAIKNQNNTGKFLYGFTKGIKNKVDEIPNGMINSDPKEIDKFINQHGGGIQLKLGNTIQELLDGGYIRKVEP